MGEMYSVLQIYLGVGCSGLFLQHMMYLAICTVIGHYGGKGPEKLILKYFCNTEYIYV